VNKQFELVNWAFHLFYSSSENCDLTEMPNTLQDRVPKKF